MIILYRSFLLISFAFIILSLKQDTLSGYTVPPSAQSVCVGDLDLDGFNDIVIGHNYNDEYNFGGVSILSNQSWGYFSFTDSIYAYSNEWAVAVAQLDSIPMKEILFNKYDPIFDSVYIGIKINNTSEIRYLNTKKNGSVDCLLTGDIDGNGYDDIVFSCNQYHFWGVFYNNGNLQFSTPEIHYLTNYYPSGLAVGDLNNDGRDDIVLCGQLLDIYFSYSSGFQNLQLSAGGFAGGVSITDFDLDGEKDILVNSGFGSTVLIMYKNNGNSTFQKMADFIFQPACGRFFVADFNNDGLPDVIYQNPDNDGYILWYNQGNFQLANSLNISVPYIGEPTRNFTCADLDNNAFIDIITVRFDAFYIANNVDVRFNDGQGHFIPNPIVGIKFHPEFRSFGISNYPNPFSNETLFNIHLKETALTEISVFNLQGVFVKCLINQKLEGGSHTIKWCGLDNGGQPCKPGTFLAYLKVNSKICQVIKVVKI